MKTRSSVVAEKLRDALHYTNLLVFMEEVTNLPGNLPGAAAPVPGEPGTSEALGPGEPSSP